jgi:hypothetical protein
MIKPTIKTEQRKNDLKNSGTRQKGEGPMAVLSRERTGVGLGRKAKLRAMFPKVKEGAGGGSRPTWA